MHVSVGRVLALLGWYECGKVYLVEVDVHALELEVGRAIVPTVHQCVAHIHCIRFKRTRQRHQGHARRRCSARRQHLSGCPSHVVNTHPHFSSTVDITYTLAGLEVNLCTGIMSVSCSCSRATYRRGARVWARGHVCRGRTHDFPHAGNFGGVIMAYAVMCCVRFGGGL
jgi:hypothetical protein